MRRYKSEKDAKLWEAVRKFLRSCELYSPAYNEPTWTHVDAASHMFVMANDVQVTVYWFKQVDGDIAVTNVYFSKPEDE